MHPRVAAGAALAAVAAFGVAACDDRPGSAGSDGAEEDVPADSTYFVAAALPDGYRLVSSQDRADGGTRAHYGNGPVGSGDFDLAVDVYDGPPQVPAGAGEETEVRGLPARLLPLTDEGRTHGLELVWEERPGLTIEVEAGEPLGEDEARVVAEGLEPVTEQRWHALQTGVDPAAADGRIVPDMTRVEAGAGTANGERWTLAALIPPGYPLGDFDIRAPCYELAYRGATHQACATTAWSELGGQIFVSGEATVAVEQVSVTTTTGETVGASVLAVDAGPDVRYWVAAMPPDTCFVRVDSAPVDELEEQQGTTPMTMPGEARAACVATGRPTA